jgi:hypothetical protein
MAARTLIQMIEDHSEQITARVVRRIQLDPELAHAGRLPEWDLRDRAQEVLKNLGRWLAKKQEEELAKRYEWLGRLRYEESVPLHETVRSVQILKDQMLDFIREQGVGQSSMELYEEEELEHRAGLFFDDLIYHLVRGYEGALRKAAHLVA